MIFIVASVIAADGWVQLPIGAPDGWLLAEGARPAFSHSHPRLQRYYRLPDLSRVAGDPRVLRTWTPFPIPPPADISPVTDDFRHLQTWMDADGGLSIADAAFWPGGDGGFVRLADVEYAWEDNHEDLEATIGIFTEGVPYPDYAFHGNSVLGMLAAGPNGYGVDGAVPGAELEVFFPVDEGGNYVPAEAIVAALETMGPGDVLLIEQQGYAHDGYCPASADPAVMDAITTVVEAGIVVVEPAGNGGQDLDAGYWRGAWEEDSGSIMVGGGVPAGDQGARSWYPYGSSYGSRVDLQGWYTEIVTTTTGQYEGAYADLALVDGDGRQAYTRTFGGTSGASPMVAAAATVLQSVSLAAGQPPWDPRELRAAMVAAGTPQTGDEQVGPAVDVRRMLRIWAR